MKCNVTLDNGGTVFTSTGELRYVGEGFDLSYELGGDMCRLRYDGKTLFETRRGSLCLDMTFSEHEETFCKLSDGELTGSFPLFTHGLAVTKTPSGLKISVIYDFSWGKTRLNITVGIN